MWRQFATSLQIILPDPVFYVSWSSLRVHCRWVPTLFRVARVTMAEFLFSKRRSGCGTGADHSGGDKQLVMCCIVLFNQYFGIVTPEVSSTANQRGPSPLSPFGDGVSGSSPSTLKPLVIPIPSSSSSHGHTTATLTTKGLCPGGSVVWAGAKFVRPTGEGSE